MATTGVRARFYLHLVDFFSLFFLIILFYYYYFRPVFTYVENYYFFVELVQGRQKTHGHGLCNGTGSSDYNKIFTYQTFRRLLTDIFQLAWISVYLFINNLYLLLDKDNGRIGARMESLPQNGRIWPKRDYPFGLSSWRYLENF